MDEYTKEAVREFQESLANIEASNLDIELILVNIKKEIIENTLLFFKTDNIEQKENLKSSLAREYNYLYYFQAKRNGVSSAYRLDSDIQNLPDIFLIDQKPERFEIDNELLANININEGLTMEEALELLKWTSNNTRDNITKHLCINLCDKEQVYGNASLISNCGISQLSSLYPLQKMGLKITINNTGQMSYVRHAYGTVEIPIRTENGIVNKRFIIDCTYRQFFIISQNVVSRYLYSIHSSPDAGFFINKTEDDIEFAKELLKNGFIEATDENLEKYLKPFFSSFVDINEINKIDERFSELNIIDILENKQVKFDDDEDGLISGGYNIDFPQSKNKVA